MMTPNRHKSLIGQPLKQRLGIMLLITVCSINTGSVNASNDKEHATLARLLSELQALDTIVRSAKHAAQEDDRQRFDYDALRRDLALIEAGITDHLTMTRRDPRLLPALKAEYRQ